MNNRVVLVVSNIGKTCNKCTLLTSNKHRDDGEDFLIGRIWRDVSEADARQTAHHEVKAGDVDAAPTWTASHIYTVEGIRPLRQLKQPT